MGSSRPRDPSLVPFWRPPRAGQEVCLWKGPRGQPRSLAGNGLAGEVDVRVEVADRGEGMGGCSSPHSHPVGRAGVWVGRAKSKFTIPLLHRQSSLWRACLLPLPAPHRESHSDEAHSASGRSHCTSEPLLCPLLPRILSPVSPTLPSCCVRTCCEKPLSPSRITAHSFVGEREVCQAGIRHSVSWRRGRGGADCPLAPPRVPLALHAPPPPSLPVARPARAGLAGAERPKRVKAGVSHVLLEIGDKQATVEVVRPYMA